MRSCIIIGAAPIKNLDYLKPYLCEYDFLVAADGGYEYAELLGVVPDVIVGDFDSSDISESCSNSIKVYPKLKDDTDMMIAVKEGLKNECTHFYIFGALGGRFDHSLGNVLLLNYLLDNNAFGVLIDSRNYVYAVDPANPLIIKKKDNYKISLIPISDECTVIKTTGLLYSLFNARLTNAYPLGISNEFISQEAKISLENGRMIVVVSEED